MKRLRVFLSLMVALAVLFGCSQEATSPADPGNGDVSNRVATLQGGCGESEYLTDLSPVLVSWKDSLEAWRGSEFLPATPLFEEDDDVAEYLLDLSPALSEWEDSINTWLDSSVVDTPPVFSSGGSTSAYLTELSPTLLQWQDALEDFRGFAFLADAPVFEGDITAPDIACPADTTIVCADSSGAALEFEVTVQDGCDSAPEVTCLPASGSVFPLGETEVMCTAVDSSGNESECSFTVTVVAAVAPVITCPADTTVACTGEGATVEFNVTAESECDTSVTVTCVPPSGSHFPLGNTTVVCTAEDAFGNTVECSFTVTVDDTVPPVIHGATATPAMLWPPNHKLANVAIEVNVTDACDAAPKCWIVDVTSNEDINGIGDGNTKPDWEIVGDLVVKLRAERSGTGGGRVYNIHIVCEDGSGATSETSVDVFVPHDRGTASSVEAQ